MTPPWDKRTLARGRDETGTVHLAMPAGDWESLDRWKMGTAQQYRRPACDRMFTRDPPVPFQPTRYPPTLSRVEAEVDCPGCLEQVEREIGIVRFYSLHKGKAGSCLAEADSREHQIRWSATAPEMHAALRRAESAPDERFAIDEYGVEMTGRQFLAMTRSSRWG